MRVLSTTAEFLGVNCYVAAPDGGAQCVLVDAGLDGAPGVAALLAEHGLRPAAIVLTHGHPDHVLGLPGYVSRWDVPVYLAAPDHFRLADPAGTLDGQFGQIVRSLVPGWSAPSALDLPVAEPLTVAGLRISTLPSPGHTEGSVVLTVTASPAKEPADPAAAPAGSSDGQGPAERVYFTGDVLFAGSVGRTDLPGGDPEAMAASLAAVRELPDAPVYPGHGPATSIGAELAANPFLR